MIGMKEPGKRPGFDDIFEFGEKDYAEAAKMAGLEGNGKKIIIHAGSGWKIKLWENEKWIELLRKINELGDFRFIFVGSCDFEEKSFEHIQENLDFKIYSLINKADLKKILLVMRMCDYFIGIDSGPRNMAHLADLRSISLLGPAPKNFMPFNGEDIVIDKFDCRCKSLFYLHKISGMQKISANEVFDNFKKLSKAPAEAMDLQSRESVRMTQVPEGT
jgi:ADP-heptose:LPS heptosyltransferase